METIALLVFIIVVLVVIAVLSVRDRQQVLKYLEAEQKLEEIRQRSRWKSKLKE